MNLSNCSYNNFNLQDTEVLMHELYCYAKIGGKNDESIYILFSALHFKTVGCIEILLSPRYKLVPIKHWSEIIFRACKLIMSYVEKQHTPILSIYIRYLYPILIIYVSYFACIINICILCRECVLCLKILSTNTENTLYIVQYLILAFLPSSNRQLQSCILFSSPLFISLLDIQFSITSSK